MKSLDQDLNWLLHSHFPRDSVEQEVGSRAGVTGCLRTCVILLLQGLILLPSTVAYLNSSTSGSFQPRRLSGNRNMLLYAWLLSFHKWVLWKSPALPRSVISVSSRTFGHGKHWHVPLPFQSPLSSSLDLWQADLWRPSPVTSWYLNKIKFEHVFGPQKPVIIWWLLRCPQ